MIFDILAFADYSGSASLYDQKRHIYLATAKANHDKIKTTGGYSRAELQKIITDILSGATKNNKRVLFGFDHNYAFPDGFIDCITGSAGTNWRQFMKIVNSEQGIFSRLRVNPREWASQVNTLIKTKYRLCAGPFWGPHFVPMKKPKDIFDKLPFSEKRFIEECEPKMKSVFQLGGAGSVGLQSLWGIFHLSNLIVFCEENQIPLHCWPYDGIEVPMDKHVLIEIYPGFYNKGMKSDVNDAQNTVRYFLEQQENRMLSDLFHLPNETTSYEIIKREGWLPGIS